MKWRVERGEEEHNWKTEVQSTLLLSVNPVFISIFCVDHRLCSEAIIWCYAKGKPKAARGKYQQ